jgi:hypothetical protein
MFRKQNKTNAQREKEILKMNANYELVWSQEGRLCACCSETVTPACSHELRESSKPDYRSKHIII